MTQRETQGRTQIAEGRSNAGTAERPSMSQRTIETDATTISTEHGNQTQSRWSSDQAG